MTDNDGEFRRTYQIRWADADPNRHARHTSFDDYAAHARLMFLEEYGVSSARLGELGLGQVLFRKEARYYREVMLHEEITVEVLLTGLSADGRKWSVLHRIYGEDDDLAAEIVQDGAWFELEKRKIASPPRDLLEAFQKLPRAEGFRVIGAKSLEDLPADLTTGPISGEDLEACRALLETLPARQRSGVSPDALGRMQVIAAREGVDIAAFLALEQDFDRTGLIQVIAIDPERPELPVGRRLLQNAERRFRRNGIEYLRAKVPDDASSLGREFYEALGFAPLEKTADDRIVMVKQI